MHAERSHTPSKTDDRDDWGILICLIHPDDQRPWSVDELARERGDEIATHDAVSRLARLGLIHLTSDGLVFPTRAALHYTEIRA